MPYVFSSAIHIHPTSQPNFAIASRQHQSGAWVVAKDTHNQQAYFDAASGAMRLGAQVYIEYETYEEQDGNRRYYWGVTRLVPIRGGLVPAGLTPVESFAGLDSLIALTKPANNTSRSDSLRDHDHDHADTRIDLQRQRKEAMRNNESTYWQHVAEKRDEAVRDYQNRQENNKADAAGDIMRDAPAIAGKIYDHLRNNIDSKGLKLGESHGCEVHVGISAGGVELRVDCEF